MTEYLTTLAGPPPQGEAARIFYAKVAKMTGIPEEDVAKSRGFLRELLLEESALRQWHGGRAAMTALSGWTIPSPIAAASAGRSGA